MPVFKNENINEKPLRYLDVPKPELQSVEYKPIPEGNIPNFSNTGTPVPMTMKRLSNLTGGIAPTDFSQPFSSVSAQTLYENKKYPFYQEGVDLENIYGIQQSAWNRWGNAAVKFGATSVGTFLQSFAAIPNIVDAIRKKDFSQLSGDLTGYEGNIDMWMRNLEDTFPNYYSRYERDHPWLATIPFAPGSANFWGDKFLKNLGFTVGAITGTLAQDFIITGLTGGVGTAPLMAAQAARWALRLNKVAAVFKAETILARTAKAVNVTKQAVNGLEALETLSTLAKVKNAAQFYTVMLGASMTEAGVESREGYRQIKEELINDYKMLHGVHPVGEEAELIEKIATDAMNVRFGINTALLLVSNSALFGNTFRNFKTATGSITGNYSLKSGPLSNLKSIGLKEKSLDVFERKATKGFVNKAWEASKSYLPVMFSEGVFEEGLQFATEKGTYDYFTRKYKNLNNPNNREAWQESEEAMKSIMHGLNEQFTTDEGLQNMFIGALTGMFVTGTQKIIDKKRKTDRDTRTDKVINSLNIHHLTNIFNKQFEDVVDMTAISKEMKQAVVDKDIFKYNNLNAHNFFKFVNARSRMGAHEVSKEQLELLKDLDKAEFEKMFGLELNEENAETVSSYVNTLIEQADKINKIVTSVNNTYKNPFTFKKQPESPEEGLENFNHNIFESWKEEVSTNTFMMDYMDRVSKESDEFISRLVPTLNGEVVSNLTGRKSLNEVAEELEQDASMLEASIEVGTSARERSKIRKQIKKLRNLAGQASILGNNLSLSEEKSFEYFSNLVSFEANGRNIEEEEEIFLSPQEISIVAEAGSNITRAKQLKSDLKTALTDLTKEAGFKKYIESAEDVRNQVIPEEKGEVLFKNADKEDVPVEVGREYEIAKKKPLQYKKISNDRWEVPQLDGSKIYTKTEPQAKIEIAQVNEAIEASKKIKVEAINPNGSLKVQDDLGNIYNIDPSRLKGYSIIQSFEEYAEEKKQEIEQEEEKVGQTATDIITVNRTSPFADEGGRKKHYAWLFTSTTTMSEGYNYTKGTDKVASSLEEEFEEAAPHIVRSRLFLNRARFFKNRNKMKGIIVSPKQIEQLGLNGILEQSYNGKIPKDVSDPNTGWMGYVFIVEEDGKKFYVDENGEPISEVGQQVDLDKVIYQTLPDTSLIYRSDQKTPKYRQHEKNEAEAIHKRWVVFRDNYFKSNKDPMIFPFRISKGLGIIIEGKERDRHFIGHLIPESVIGHKRDLIVIPTSGFHEFNNQNLAVPKGVPILNYRDISEFLQNRKLTTTESETIYELLKVLSGRVLEKFKKNEKPTLLSEESRFIQNLIYWKSKGVGAEGNQIRVNIGLRQISIGKENFDMSKIENNRESLIEALEDTYMSVNRLTLEKEFDDKFEEFYIDEKGELAIREWDNYQTYLLSNKYPDGSNRKDIPLTTNIAPPSGGVEVTHKQKYAILQGLELPSIQTVAAGQQPQETPPVYKQINDKLYNLNGVEVNTYTFSTGNVEFIGSIDEKGIPSVSIIRDSVETQATIKTISKNEKALQGIYNAYKVLTKEEPTVEQKETQQEELIINVYESSIEQIFANLLKEETQGAKPVKPVVEDQFVFDGTIVNTTNIKGQFPIQFTAELITLPSGNVVVKPTMLVNETNAATMAKVSKDADVLKQKPLFVKQNKILDNSSDLDYAQAYLELQLKYAAQLAYNGDSTPPSNTPPTGPKTPKKGFTDLKGIIKDDPETRLKGSDDRRMMTSEELEIFKKWHAKNVPNIPFEVLEEMITTKYGRQAWGVFEFGVAKFVEGGLAGTEYHEIFEGIWAGMLTPEEKIDILNEFRDSKGEFVDRVTGKTYLKSDPSVSDQMIKERIADDFADFRLKKIAPKTLGQKILNFFKRIIEFFKNFNKTKSKIDTLFDEIDSAKFKDRQLSPYVVAGINKEIYTKVTSNLSEFEGTIIEFVDHIGYKKDGRSIGARNINKGEKIQVVLSAMKEKYENKTWMTPFSSEPLPENTFNSFEEFMLFMYLHEKAHEYILREEGESIGSYETRVNEEALRRLDDEFRLKPEYRYEEILREVLTEGQILDLIDDITVASTKIIFTDNKATLFKFQAITKEDLESTVSKRYKDVGLEPIVWDILFDKTLEKLRTIGIEFDETNELNINEEQSNSKEYTKNPFEVNLKSTVPRALRFVLSTLYEVEQDKSPTLFDIPAKKKSVHVGGYKLLNYSEVSGILLDKLSNVNSKEEFVKRLGELAETDANFIAVYNRLGGTFIRKNNVNESYFDFDSFDKYDWYLFNQAYHALTKYNPEAMVEHKSEEEVYVVSINKLGTGKELSQSWVDSMKLLANDPESLVYYDESKRVYKIKTLQATISQLSPTSWKVVDSYGNEERFETKANAQRHAKIVGIYINSDAKTLDFLNKIGIKYTEADVKKLDKDQKSRFNKAASSLHTYFGENNEIATLSGKTLGVNKQLLELANLYIEVNGLSKENTHFGVDGKRRGNYSQDNYPSIFSNDFAETNSIDELKALRPELNDVYSKHSLILTPGSKYANMQGKWKKRIKVSYAQGSKDLTLNAGTTTIDLKLVNRYIQEINHNLNGHYYIIIPGDSNTEWMIELGNNVSFKDISTKTSWDKVLPIFIGYLKDEIALALDYENRKYIKSLQGRGKQLRMFREILPSGMVAKIEEMIENDATLNEFDAYIEQYKNSIRDSVRDFIAEETSEVLSYLYKYGQIELNKDGTYRFAGLDSNFATYEKVDKNKLTENELNNILNYINVNYAINVIEMHKVLFGDPYLFNTKAGVPESIKRIKSFLSPGSKLLDFKEYNTFLDQEMNNAGDISLDKTDYGYHKFKRYANTVVIDDVILFHSLANTVDQYSAIDSTDGFSWLKDTTYREIMLKDAQWSDEAEAFFQWQMAFTRQNMPGYKYKNEELRKHDKGLMKTPAPKYYLKVLKPIVRGPKANKQHIDLVVDKFAQMPIFYSMVKGTNMEKQYIKMFKENIDYAIVKSGRKVGQEEESHPMYVNGRFNDELYNNVVEIPWKIYAIQLETAHNEDKLQTRGSQITKMATINLFENGEPVGETAERKAYIQGLYDENIDLLDRMHEHGYKTLLKKLGMVDAGEGDFFMKNGKKLHDSLAYEMLRREVNENTKKAIELDENEQFIIPFEATPSYVQIKDIIYSMLNKALLSPKMSGGAHVQVPSTLFERNKELGFAIKRNDGWEKITYKEYEALSDEEKGTVVLTNDYLKFYEDKDGKRYMEILIPHWFKDQFKGIFATDEELLKHLNSSKELQQVLRGIGFRIPSQALSSIEVFKVKGFLPQYMGSTVVVPGEITTKTGGDFDIDKLNMYLKSLYVNAKGEIHLVKLYNTEEETKEFYGRVFDQILDTKKTKLRIALKNNKERVAREAEKLTDKAELFKDYKDASAEDVLEQLLNQLYTQDDLKSASFYEQLEKFNDEELQEVLKDNYIDSMYKRALENTYYTSLEKILTLKENFIHLITPISDGGLKATAEKIRALRARPEVKNKMLRRSYLTKKRNDLALAKKWIGIAATNITSLTNRQKGVIYFDREKIIDLPIGKKLFIGNGTIQLPHNTVTINGVEYLSLSKIKTAEPQAREDLDYISNIFSGMATATVDVTTDDYILDLIPSNLLVNISMFLEAIGAGEKGRMFMAQPIIVELAEMLDSQNISYLSNEQVLEKMKDMFPVSAKYDPIDNVIDLDSLEDNIKTYAEAESRTTEKMLERNDQQRHILNELLKYDVLAKDLFLISQATNYDTKKIRNGEMYMRKAILLEMALNNNLFSGVEGVLDNTFIGKQKDYMSLAIDHLDVVFTLDNTRFKRITDEVVKRYASRDFIKEDVLDSIIQKIKIEYLDSLIQSNFNLSQEIQRLIKDKETSVVARLEAFKLKYNNIYVVNQLEHDLSQRVEGANTVRLRLNDADIYNQNFLIGSMRELRDFNAETHEFYRDLIMISFLQGTQNSRSSIRSIIPMEDFADTVQPLVEQVMPVIAKEVFHRGMFERNNHNNKDIVPVYIPNFSEPKEWQDKDLFTASLPISEYENIYYYYSPVFTHHDQDVKNLGLAGPFDIRIMQVNSKYAYKAVQSDYLRVPRTVKVYNKTEERTDYFDIAERRSIGYDEFNEARKKGDRSFYQYIGYEKVKKPNGDPVIFINDKGDEIYIYKQINLLGDGRFLKEYYEYFKPSEVDNGTVKVDGQEIPNDKILTYFAGLEKAELEPERQYTFLPFRNDDEVNNIAKIEAGEKTITNRSKVYENGIYPVGDGKYVSLTMIGQARVVNMSKMFDRPVVQFSNGKQMTLDEFARKEGFKDAKDFQENNSYSSRFVKGDISRWVYEVRMATPTQEEKALMDKAYKERPVNYKEFDSKAVRPFFDALPEKSPTPTFTYTGVGSRKVPNDISLEMTKAARWLESQGYTLMTGDASGSDQSFREGASKKEVFTAKDANDQTRTIAKETHPNPDALNQVVLDLMARNTNQVFGKTLDTPVDFVLAWTPLTKEGVVVTHANQVRYYGRGDENNTGGTGQAITIASLKGIPVINMADPNWRKELEIIVKNAKKEKSVLPKEEEQKLEVPDNYQIIKQPDRTYDVLHIEDGIMGERYESYEEAVKAAIEIESQTASIPGEVNQESELSDDFLTAVEQVQKKIDASGVEKLKGKNVSNNPTKPERDSNLPKEYELFPGVYANKEQKEAIDGLKEFLNNPNEDAISLVGRGGTGKTTIIKKITENYKGSIMYIAPTHKAKNILAKSVGEKASTLASALAIDLDETTGKFKPNEFKRSRFGIPLGKVSLIVIDEGSMVNDSLFNEILEEKRGNAKVIFMGDNVQLPPVGQKTDSKMFELKHFKLIERMRQGEQSPIVPLTDVLANNIENAVPKERVITDRTNKFTETDSVIFTNDYNAFIDDFIKVYKTNPAETRIITFNNQLNNNTQSVKNVNIKVRNILNPEDPSRLRKGDQLMAYGSTILEGGNESDARFDVINSNEYTVEEIIEDNASTKFQVVASSRARGQRYTPVLDLTGQKVLLKDKITDKVLSAPMFIYDQNSLAQIRKLQKEYLAEKDFQMNIKIEQVVPNLEFAYAITSHKSQGSTYDNVYVLEDNILQGSLRTNKEKNQSLYVATSRAKFRLMMHSRLNPVSKIEDAKSATKQTPVKQATPQPPSSTSVSAETVSEQTKNKVFEIDHYALTLTPGGEIFYKTGNRVQNPTIINKVKIADERERGVLRVSNFNNSSYFVLSDDTILGAGATNFGKESVTNPEIKEQILSKAILWKKRC